MILYLIVGVIMAKVGVGAGLWIVWCFGLIFSILD